MLIDGKVWQTIWFNKEEKIVEVIDQTKLPHEFSIKKIFSAEDAAQAIKNMVIRGAPLIGVMGAYGLMLAIKESPSDKNLIENFKLLLSTRPTAINLKWALKRVYKRIINVDKSERLFLAINEAQKIEKEDIKMCSKIGENGLSILRNIYIQNNQKYNKNNINILTHCNAGWLATIDWGTATSPIYHAHKKGIPIHVWVDETRPRNQGASLTSFELEGEGIPHTVIVDNAGGYLMQKNQVDLVIVGSDRTTSKGDVCNKIGTYLKALAANDCNVPFYAALPFSTIDWELSNGLEEIEIEIRNPEEVSIISGVTQSDYIEEVRIVPEFSKCFNPSFDVTPAKLVTGLITERGISSADYNGLKKLYIS